MSHISSEPLDKEKLILVFGRDGQVGKALQTYLQRLKVPAIFLSRNECDLSNELSIRKTLNRYQPQIIINAAAYTDVDKAEVEQALTFAINSKAPQLMANYIANIADGILVHYSTEYVFADTKQSAYLETEAAGPAEQLSIYGQSKLAGEKGIEAEFNLVKNLNYSDNLHKKSKYFILRTSWVYGEGNNFIRTMLNLARDRNQFKVVTDQVGVPTAASWLAEIAVQLSSSYVESGIYHAVPDGETSRYNLAIFAIKVAAMSGAAIKVKPENIMPTTSIKYSLPAKRPYNSRLNNAKLKQALSQIALTGQYPNWHEAVEAYVTQCINSSLKI